MDPGSEHLLSTVSASRQYSGHSPGVIATSNGLPAFDLLWPALYLLTNTVLTAATATRIMYVSSWAAFALVLMSMGYSIYRKHSTFRASRSHLLHVGRAIVESALLSWPRTTPTICFPVGCLDQCIRRNCGHGLWFLPRSNTLGEFMCTRSFSTRQY